MDTPSPRLQRPLLTLALACWFVFHVAANTIDLIPVLPGLEEPAAWEEPRFQDEWRRWNAWRGESLEETRMWWQNWGTRLSQARTTLRAPFAWYLDALGFQQDWDVFRAGTRLAPVLEISGQTCAAEEACDTIRLFRYGEGGVMEDIFQNARMRAQVDAWFSGRGHLPLKQGCQAIAARLSELGFDLHEVECQLSLVPTPSPEPTRPELSPWVVGQQRVVLPHGILSPPFAERKPE